MAGCAPRVSVLIPCFNAGRYLEATLTSVFAQAPVPFEVIVVDDGSTDGSAAIARRFGERVRVEEQANRGISGARNRCLDLATGDLIAFLDADDLWPPDSLGCRLRCLAEPEAPAIAYGLVEQFISPELPEEVRRTLHCPPGAQAARLASTMLIRRHVLDRVGRFDESLRVGETMDWVARADALGLAMRAVDQVVLRRRLHDTNTGASHRDQRTDYVRALRASILRRRASPADRSPPA